MNAENVGSEVRKQALLEEHRAARNEIEKAITGLSFEDMESPMNEKGLRVRDLLAHWVEWDSLELERTDLYLDGEEIDMEPDEDNDSFNRRAIEGMRNKSTGYVLDLFYRYSDAVEGTLDSLSEEELFRDRGDRFKDEIVCPAWFLVEVKHDRDHAKEIMEWREREGI